MFKTSKLFKGEIKKIFFGPGMILMAGIFLLALALFPSLFSPSERKTITTEINLSSTSISEANSSFLSYKNIYENDLSSLYNEVNTLVEYNENFKENLISLADELYNLRLSFASAANVENIEGPNGCFSLHLSLIEKVNELKNLYNSYINDYFIPLILVNEDLDFQINMELNLLINVLTENTDISGSIDFYNRLNLTLDEYGSVSKIKDLFAKVNSVTYSSTNLTDILNNYYTSKDSYLQDLLSQMNNIIDINSSSEEDANSRESFINLAKHYLYTLSYLNVSIKNSVLLEISNHYSDSTLSNYLGFENFNSYELSENRARSDYYLENNLIEEEISNVFMFNTNSSTTTNAFDYMYFSMEVISIFIVAFTVIIGAGMISKEYSDGTIKLLAIRPYKRSKIMLAKIMATLFISFLFVMIAVIMSTIIGIIIYGITFPSMLVVFNAQVTFTLPIWVVFLIYLLCLIIKISIYSLLAIAISTIFKSYVVSVCVSSGIYLLNIILTFVSNGASWLKFNPFANLDLFKYFGGSFISNTNSSNITSLFYSPVFADTSIWLSITIILVFAVVLNILIFTIFKKRDIT